MPKVTVVIPAYNRARFLPAAIDSALAQTYRDFEVVVVDDGSTDNTAEVLDSYSSRIRAVQQQNGGEGSARNRGVFEGKGDFVAFLDSDDMWRPNKLAAQMDLIGTSPDVKWAFTDAMAFDGESGKALFRLSGRAKQFSGEVARRLLLVDFIPTSTVVVHRAVFEELGRFSEMRVVSDWEMWLRIAARYTVGRCPDVLAEYRIHPGGVSGELDVEALLASRLEVIRQAASTSPSVYGKFVRVARSRQYISAARGYLRLGDLRRARAMWYRGMRLAPRSPDVWSTVLPLFLGGTIAKRLISEYDRIRDRAI